MNNNGRVVRKRKSPRHQNRANLSFKKSIVSSEDLSSLADDLRRGHENYSLSGLVDHLSLEVENIDDCSIYTHQKDKLLLDATSVLLINLGHMNLYNVFKMNSNLNTVIITSCNFKHDSKILCKVIRDIMTAHSKKIQIVGCDLPNKIRREDLKIIEINSIDHKLQSLEIINCEASERQLLAIKDLIKILKSNQEFEFNIIEDSDSF